MNLLMRSLLIVIAGFTAVDLSVNAQTIVVQDTFTLNGPDRTAGAELVGTTPEIGSGVWVSSFYASNSIFNSSGQIVRAANSTTEARIAIATPSVATTVSADLTGINGGWSAIGFTTSATSSVSGAWPAQGYGTAVWARIQAGKYFIDVNGTAYQIASGSISGFSYSKIYTVSLGYDPDSLSVSLTISTSGSEVVDTGLISVSNVSSAAGTYLSSQTIKAAGFTLNGAVIDSNTPLIDNFTVTAIPEPATASVFLGGIAGLCGMFFAIRRARRS